MKKNIRYLTHEDKVLLISYDIPVALISNEGYFKTDQKYSSTTTRHINEGFSSSDYVQEKPQSFFDAIYEEMKNADR